MSQVVFKPSGGKSYKWYKSRWCCHIIDTLGEDKVEMASPEVSRPMTSPVRGPPAGGSSSSRKVVTFGTDSRPVVGAGDHQHAAAAAARQRSKSGHQKGDAAGKDENSETKRAPFPQPVTSNQFSSSRKAFRPESRPIRKRSYSFSEGTNHLLTLQHDRLLTLSSSQ